VIRLSLDDPNITVEDDDQLGDLGLDSLRRLNVVALLEERAGVSIADDRVTATTTVAELRALVSEGSPAAAAVRPARWPYRPWVRAVGDELRDRGIAPLVKHWVTLSVEGVENLETLSSPGLFIFNHSDDFDGPVIYEALPRDIRRRLAAATGADVMANHRALALIVRLCYAGFPFARSEPYMPSLEYVGQMIDRGYHVLIAPEGRLSTNGELQEFKTGIGLLAASLAVPVVPMKTIGLSGTVQLHAKWPRRRSRVTVRIGPPMQFGVTADYEDVTQKLRRAVEEL
jgi:long-chain acyl-CoA synthetase